MVPIGIGESLFEMEFLGKFIQTPLRSSCSFEIRFICGLIPVAHDLQVVLLHHMLSKSVVKARPSVLWCYKKNLGFTTHRQKRMKEIQKKVRNGTLDINEQDPFELFVSSTTIRYTYYHETHKILGQTFGEFHSGG